MNKEMTFLIFLITSNFVFANDIADFLNRCEDPKYAKEHPSECKEEEASKKRLEEQGKANQKAEEEYRKKHPKVDYLCNGQKRTFAKVPFIDPDTNEPATDKNDAPIMITALNQVQLDKLFKEEVNQYSKAELVLRGSKLEDSSCEHRAQYIGCKLRDECGIMTGKVFIHFKDGPVPVVVGKDSLGRDVVREWSNHVANGIYLADQSGKMKLMVIDRLVNNALGTTGPIPYDVWLNHLTSKGKYAVSKVLTYPPQSRPGMVFNRDNRPGGKCEHKTRDEMMAIGGEGAKQEEYEAIGTGVR